MREDKIIRIEFGDMEAVYRINESKQVSFGLVPRTADKDESEKLFLNKGKVSPLVQVSCTGDASGLGFCAGQTRHDSNMTMSMQYVDQEIFEKENEKTVITYLENEDKIRVEHIAVYNEGCREINVFSRVINKSNIHLMLEKISSFCLSQITPYDEGAASERLLVHQFRSRWSAEGRHEIRTVEDLMLEPSWANFGTRCEKIGAVGSMPVRGYFPFLAIEDTKEGVIWAVTNECSSSWQIETVRNDENLCVCGGLGDYEYAHWRKSLKPGESFETPRSYITAVRGDFDEACDRLLDAQRNDFDLLNEDNVCLPAFFNEYCTTWGEPSEDKIRDMLSKVNSEHFDYFVIDAGWYADSIKGWQDNMGDWNVASDLFPNGMKKVVKMIKDAGMKAGIWFELEVVGKDADAVGLTEHLLTRDGKVIVSGTRRFWDMRSKWVDSYLTEKVIDFLKDNGFEYIKIDYNDTIGIGCDGAESVGEGLRQVVEATKRFFVKIKKNVPGIAIEVCSSGGHRLEPGFMKLADCLSFSDAHEEKEIPVIAADLDKLILASKSQIWSVLRKTDDFKRIAYSVCAGMYGVLCISGDVFELDKEKWEFALCGVDFYKTVSNVIAKGKLKRFGGVQNSNRNLRGYQASVRYGEDAEALVLAHSFYHEGVQKISIPLEGDYEILQKYETGNHSISIAGRCMEIEFEENFDAVAVCITKK